MGISGLLPVLRPVTRTVHISKYAGHKVAIDGYSWLHKAVYCCAKELCLGQYTNKFVQFCLNRVDMLRQNGVEPILVFDGGPLPSKAKEEDVRGKSRQENLDRAMSYLSNGNMLAAEQAFQKAVDVTPSMTKQVIEEMKSRNVRCLVAPYEADAQMAYLAIRGDVHAVLTEDSDLLAYGCPRVLFKLDKAGNGEEVLLEELHMNSTVSFVGFTHHMFQEMCVMAGCDFLPNLPQIGVKKAHGYIKKFRSFTKVCRHLRFEGRVSVPPLYEQDFQRALWVFRHQRVYCPHTHTCVHLRPLPPGGLGAADVDVPAAIPPQRASAIPGAPPEDDTDFLGPPLEPVIVRGIAEGELDPFSKTPFDLTTIYRGCDRPPPSVAQRLAQARQAAGGAGGGGSGGGGVLQQQQGMGMGQGGFNSKQPWTTLFDMRMSGGGPGQPGGRGSGTHAYGTAAAGGRSSSTGSALQPRPGYAANSTLAGHDAVQKCHSAGKMQPRQQQQQGSDGLIKSPLIQGSIRSLFAAAHKRSQSTLAAPFVPPSRVGQHIGSGPSSASSRPMSPTAGCSGAEHEAGPEAAAHHPVTGAAFTRPHKMFKVGLSQSNAAPSGAAAALLSQHKPQAELVAGRGNDEQGLAGLLVDRTNFQVFSCKPRQLLPAPPRAAAWQEAGDGWITRKRRGAVQDLINTPQHAQHEPEVDPRADADEGAGDAAAGSEPVAAHGSSQVAVQGVQAGRASGRPVSALAVLGVRASGCSSSQVPAPAAAAGNPDAHGARDDITAAPADGAVDGPDAGHQLMSHPSSDVPSSWGAQQTSSAGGTCLQTHLVVTSSEDSPNLGRRVQGVGVASACACSASPDQLEPGARAWTPDGHARLLYESHSTPCRVAAAMRQGCQSGTPQLIPDTPPSSSRRLRTSVKRHGFPWLQETEDQVQMQLCQAGLRSVRPVPTSIAAALQAHSPELVLRGRHQLPGPSDTEISAAAQVRRSGCDDSSIKAPGNNLFQGFGMAGSLFQPRTRPCLEAAAGWQGAGRGQGGQHEQQAGGGGRGGGMGLATPHAGSAGPQEPEDRQEEQVLESSGGSPVGRQIAEQVSSEHERQTGQQAGDGFHSLAHVQQYAELAVAALDDVEQAVQRGAAPADRLAQFACTAAAGKAQVECVTIESDDDGDVPLHPGAAAMGTRLSAAQTSAQQRKQVAPPSSGSSGGWLSKASKRKGHVAGLRRPSKGSGAAAQAPSVFLAGGARGSSTCTGHGGSSSAKGKHLVQAKLGLAQFAFTGTSR